MVRSTTAGVWMLAAVCGCQPSEGTSPSDGDEGAGEQAPAEESATTGRLQVEVTYRERMILPPTATLEVVLEDGAKMDVAADVIAEAKVPVQSGPPYKVTLGYEPSVLKGNGRYGVRARIKNDGRLMFTSTQFNPAFGSQGSPDEPPNDPVKVMLTHMSGTAAPTGASITGTRWVLQVLRDEPAGTGAGGRPPDLTLQGSEPRASGFAGCNQYTGGYTLAVDQLSFGNMAMTMRACTEGMELEREFAKMLSETKSYRIEGNTLRLRDGNGTVIAILGAA